MNWEIYLLDVKVAFFLECQRWRSTWINMKDSYKKITHCVKIQNNIGRAQAIGNGLSIPIPIFLSSTKAIVGAKQIIRCT